MACAEKGRSGIDYVAVLVRLVALAVSKGPVAQLVRRTGLDHVA